MPDQEPTQPVQPKPLEAAAPDNDNYLWTSGSGENTPAPIRPETGAEPPKIPDDQKHDSTTVEQEAGKPPKPKDQATNFIDHHANIIISEYKGLKGADEFQSLIKDQSVSPFEAIAPTAESYYNQHGGLTTVTPEGKIIQTNLSPEQEADLKQTDKEFAGAGTIPTWTQMKGRTVSVGTLISVDDDFKKNSSSWFNKLLGDNQNKDGSYAWDGKYLQMRYDEGTGKVIPLPYQPFRKLAEAGADVGESDVEISAGKSKTSDTEAGQWLEGQTGRETGKDTRPVTDEMTQREGSELWRKYPTAARVKDVLGKNLPLTKLLMGNEKLFNAFKDELDNASGNMVGDQAEQRRMLSNAVDKIYNSGGAVSKEVGQAADAASRLPALAQQYGSKQKDLAAQMKMRVGDQPEFIEMAILETKMAVKPKEVTEQEAAKYKELNEKVSHRIAEAGKGTKEWEQYINNRTAYATALKSVAKAINVFTEPGNQKGLENYLQQRKGAELEERLSDYFPQVKKSEQKQEELDREGSKTSLLRGGAGALLHGVDNIALYAANNDKTSAALASHLTVDGIRVDKAAAFLTPNRSTVNSDGTPNYLNEVLNTLDSGSKMIGGMVPAMAGGWLGGAPAETIAFMAMSGQDAQDEGMRQGMKPEDAQSYGIMNGLVTAATMSLNLPSSWFKDEAKDVGQLLVDGFSHQSVLEHVTKLLVPTGKDVTQTTVVMAQAAAMEIANSVVNQRFNDTTGSKLETVTPDKVVSSMIGMVAIAHLFSKVGKVWEMGNARPILYKAFRDAPQETLQALSMARKRLLLEAANGDPKAAGGLQQIQKAHELLTEYAIKHDTLLPSASEDQHAAQAIAISDIADLQKRRAAVAPELHEVLDTKIEDKKKELREVVNDPEKAEKVVKKTLEPIAIMQAEVAPKPEDLKPEEPPAQKIFTDLDHTITTSDTDDTLTPWGEELKQQIAEGKVKPEDVHIVSKNPDTERAQKIAKELGIPIENVATGLETPEAKAEYVKSKGGGDNDIFVDDGPANREAVENKGVEAVHPDQAATHKAGLINEVKGLASEVKGFYKGLIGEHTEEALHEIAQQLHSSPGEAKGARSMVGDRIADIAEEMFPDAKVGDKFEDILGETEPITQEHIDTAKQVLETAQKKLAKALKDIEKTQAGQMGIFGGEQKGMFAMGREEAKKVLDPLREEVKKARQDYEDIKKNFQVQEEAANPDLFKKAKPTISEKQVKVNSLLDELANWRTWRKNDPEKAGKLNELKYKAFELGLTIDHNWLKNAKGKEVKKVSPDRAGGVAEDFDKDVYSPDTHNYMEAIGDKPSILIGIPIQGEDGRMLSDTQKTSAIKSIKDGKPNRAAKAIYDFMEDAVQKGEIRIADRTSGQEMAVPIKEMFEEFADIPQHEVDIEKMLDGKGLLTEEEDRLFDKYLIEDYERAIEEENKRDATGEKEKGDTKDGSRDSNTPPEKEDGRSKEIKERIADSKDPEEIAHLEKQKQLIDKYGMDSEEIKAKLEDEGKLKVKCPPGAKKRLSMRGLFKAATGLVTGNSAGKWEVVRDIKGDPHSKGGVDIIVKGQQVNAEGKELRLKSTNGTEAIIPKDQRKEMMDLIDKGDHSKISELVSHFPKGPDKAAEGGVFTTPTPTAPDPPSKLSLFRKLVVQEAWNRAEQGASGAYNLSEQNTTGQKANDDDVCIGGAADIYNSQGFKFNKTKGTVNSRGGNTTYEYNQNFAKEYKQQGFEIANDAPQEGDLVQYLNDKGEAFHMNIYMGKGTDNKDMRVFNAYNQRQGRSSMYDQKMQDSRTAIAQDGKKNKIVVYRPTEAALQGINENSLQVKKGLSNYDTQSKYQSVKKQLAGLRVDTDKKITFVLENGTEKHSNVDAIAYSKMDKLARLGLWEQMLNKK